jgi:hypothetical protein
MAIVRPGRRDQEQEFDQFDPFAGDNGIVRPDPTLSGPSGPRRYARTSSGAIVGGRGVRRTAAPSRPPAGEASRVPGQAGRVTRSRDQVNQADSAAQRSAAENLVSAPDRGEIRDSDFDTAALQSAGIAGLDENAVAQQRGRFSSVSDPETGFTVPNLADPNTNAAFNRFYGGRTTFGNRKTSNTTGVSNPGFQNQDPTRASFQNRFFPSETLKDVGGFNRRAPGRFRYS